MAWDAAGRWIPDDVAAQTQQLTALAPTTTSAPVGNQALPPVPVSGNGGLLAGATGGAANFATALQERLAARQAQLSGQPPANAPPGTPPINPGAEPVLENSTVAGQLTGLLGENSNYMRLAREGGLRTAGRRGLLNSSIAAGSGEAAAIAAAAPIASQDASQIAERNQARISSALQFRSATALQGQGDAAAFARQLSAQASAGELQGQDIAAAMSRLQYQAGTERELAILNANSQLTQQQISANASVIGNYLQAFGSLAGNPDVPAATRNAYIAEFQRVLNAGTGLSTSLPATPISWGPATSPTLTAAQIEAMKTDGIPGNYAAYQAR